MYHTQQCKTYLKVQHRSLQRAWLFDPLYGTSGLLPHWNTWEVVGETFHFHFSEDGVCRLSLVTRLKAWNNPGTFVCYGFVIILYACKRFLVHVHLSGIQVFLQVVATHVAARRCPHCCYCHVCFWYSGYAKKTYYSTGRWSNLPLSFF